MPQENATPAPHHVVLVFGDPGQGKTYLAQTLHGAHGYTVLSLDDVYVQFIRERWPQLDLPALGQVIAQHYQTILVPFGGGKSWAAHVAQVVADLSRDNPLLVVEGYLLAPALARVSQSLPTTLDTTVVEVKQRQYFVAQSAASIHSRGAA